MSKLIDLTGQRFGRLLVVERVGSAPKGRPLWSCRCECGNSCIVVGANLRNGHTQSCGCLKTVYGTTRGSSQTRLYKIWLGMKDRCCRPKNPAYPRYGGRGITVCAEWLHSFQAFWDWAIANGYRGDLSIDRIDNDKGYNPDNCRWATQKEQCSNRESNRIICIDGNSKTLTAWCNELGKSFKLVHRRISDGWTPEEALGLVKRKKK